VNLITQEPEEEKFEEPEMIDTTQPSPLKQENLNIFKRNKAIMTAYTLKMKSTWKK
jgi:hypothetical protein